MSSILDALNKLEDEKELAREQENLNPEDVDARTAAAEMIGRDVLRDTVTMRVNPMMLVGGGLALLVVLVVVVSVSVAMVLKPDAPVVEIAASAPQLPVTEVLSPEMESVQEPPVIDTPPEPLVDVSRPLNVQVTEQSAASSKTITSLDEVEPPPLEALVANDPIVITKAEPEPLPPVVEAIIEPDPVVQTRVSAPKAAPEPKPVPTAINVLALPRFTDDIQHQYGLDEMTINMVNPQSERNPYGSAIINRKKVFEDSYIADSQLRLIKVVDRGIAIEVSRTGDRFFKKF